MLFVVEYLRSLFLSYLILITQKYGSQISSICEPGSLLGMQKLRLHLKTTESISAF